MGDSIKRGIDNVGYREFLFDDLTRQGISVHFVGTQRDGPFSENHHDGHNGWTIPQLQNNSIDWLEAFHPDYILLMIGANDIEIHGNLKLMHEQMITFLETIYRLQPGVKVLVSEVTPITRADYDLLALT